MTKTYHLRLSAATREPGSSLLRAWTRAARRCDVAQIHPGPQPNRAEEFAAAERVAWWYRRRVGSSRDPMEKMLRNWRNKCGATLTDAAIGHIITHVLETSHE